MRVRHLNLSNPTHGAALQAPLAKSAGGWGLCRQADDEPVCQDAEDADYRKILAALKRIRHREEPGVKELLEMLHRQGRRLAIATAKPTASAHIVLELLQISEMFEVVSGSQKDAGRITKTEILKHALGECSSIDGAVMIGDRCYDMEAAQANGVDSIGVAFGYGTREELHGAGATHVVDVVADISAILTDASA